MTYQLPPNYWRLREQVRSYHAGFTHGWTPEQLAAAESELRDHLAADDRLYAEQCEILSAKQSPPLPSSVARAPGWMRPMGTSQVCPSGLVLDDSSQGMN